MDVTLDFKILPQPTETTCGASCLHSVYGYYGEELSIWQVINEVEHLEEGGTLSVFLATHALKRGYKVRSYTYNLQIFDPTWFAEGVDIPGRLKAQGRKKHGKKLKAATKGYLEFLSLGGEMRLEDLTSALIRKYLNRGVPILAGLSATYLYRDFRENPADASDDDVGGEPSGHFVVLCGYDSHERKVLVADPFKPNPLAGQNLYHVSIDRVVCSILLGVITYDANLLVITPKEGKKGHAAPNNIKRP